MALDYGRKIKLYVDPDGEIRRLTLSSTANFEILRNRICLLLNRENFRVFWKDSEGDLIVCCSEDEFVEACASCPPHDLLRIYIRNKPAETNANRGTSASIYLHDAVCDACNKEISGNRWKCLECADYYLCLACYHSGIHSMHDVLLICNPETKGLKRLLAKRYDASAPTKGHCDRNNGSVGRNMQRLPPEKGVNGDIPLFSHGSGYGGYFPPHLRILLDTLKRVERDSMDSNLRQNSEIVSDVSNDIMLDDLNRLTMMKGLSGMSQDELMASATLENGWMELQPESAETDEISFVTTGT